MSVSLSAFASVHEDLTELTLVSESGAKTMVLESEGTSLSYASQRVQSAGSARCSKVSSKLEHGESLVTWDSPAVSHSPTGQAHILLWNLKSAASKCLKYHSLFAVSPQL